LAIQQVVDLLACPHCRGGLLMGDDGRSVRCPQGHRFDLARQGYLNLLAGPQPVNADTAAMVAARERFLATGAFDPIAQAALGLIDSSGSAGLARILDAGAGTGHLLARLLEALPDVRGIALDVSTAASRRAARAHPRLGAVVADVWRRLPVAEDAADLVVSNFAPRNVAEFARVLSPAGGLLTITPTPDHLVELRRTYGLLEIQPGKADRLAESVSTRFRPLTADRVQRRELWSAAVVADAIAMGPSAFHDAPDRPEPRSEAVTISVDLQLWQWNTR
jgi:23S rRNA (guanine745-N1)-methyltransferase